MVKFSLVCRASKAWAAVMCLAVALSLLPATCGLPSHFRQATLQTTTKSLSCQDDKILTTGRQSSTKTPLVHYTVVKILGISWHVIPATSGETARRARTTWGAPQPQETPVAAIPYLCRICGSSLPCQVILGTSGEAST